MDSINGFNNTGSICYFNSLIQSLLSLKSFVKFISENQEKNVFTKMFYDFLNSQQKNTYFTTMLLQEILKGIKNKEDFFGQQSSLEFMTILIDMMGIEQLFEMNYCIETTCESCKNVSKKTDKTIIHNIFFIHGKTNLLQEISYTKENIDSYLCDMCNKDKDNKNIRTKATVERFLTKIPDVISISFANKYTGQICPLFYPMNFGICSSNNSNEKDEKDEKDEKEEVVEKKEKYVLLSTIEHFGSINSGHYMSRVKRGNDYFITNDFAINKLDNMNISNISYIIFYEKEII